MQLLMTGLYQKSLQESEDIRNSVTIMSETIEKFVSSGIRTSQKGNLLMKVAGDENECKLWRTLAEYGMLEFNRPKDSTLNEGRMDV